MQTAEHRFSYNWTLKDAVFTKDKGKVFSAFSCGGGSTMGYKLAGFDVIGNLEIDKDKNDAYVKNHHPQFNFCQDIREFRRRDDLPEELYHLDVLDASPPCLAFSMVGDREDVWGKETKREGVDFSQTWDDLFFELIALAKKLKPKVVVCENVKGLLLGEAIKYVRKIYSAFDEAGYYCQHFLLDAQTMGVPQRRERVFFICLRKDLAEPFLYQKDFFTIAPRIDMTFNEKPILYGEFADDEGIDIGGRTLPVLWDNRKEGDTFMADAAMRLYGKRKAFSMMYLYKNQVSPTLTAHMDSLIPFHKKKYTSKHEVCCIASFPQDYDFGNNSYHEMCGRAVPCVAEAQISTRIYEQWLSKLK